MNHHDLRSFASNVWSFHGRQWAFAPSAAAAKISTLDFISFRKSNCFVFAIVLRVLQNGAILRSAQDDGYSARDDDFFAQDDGVFGMAKGIQTAFVTFLVAIDNSFSMKLLLAPMEGVVDWVFRDTLTSIGGIDQCVTEFIRVTSQKIPDHVFFEYCPELKTNSKTRSGVPVYIQLLGGQAVPLAENAARAVELGACGIDLNFGCPAKTVNRHDGGATLLKFPDRVQNILETVRRFVPSTVPVTAKIRLGFDDPTACIRVSEAVAAAGIHTLTVHCRTKTDMYKPPAYWEWIPKIKERVKINIIANGEIWSVRDYIQCREVTGCTDVMIGRGAIANPYLFLEIRGLRETSNWSEVKSLLPDFFETNTRLSNSHFAQTRTKQWLAQISRRNLEAKDTFDELKVILEPNEFHRRLRSICVSETHL